MKRLLPVLLILLLLAGCGGTGDATGTDTTALLPQETTVLTESGIYDPDSRMEQETGGAVRVYPLGTNTCTGMELMGKDVLLFLSDDGNTRLSLLTDEQLYEKASADLNSDVFPGEPDVRVNDRGVGYYDPEANAMVFLDTEFQETSRVAVPDAVQGTPVLTRDWQTVYYCTDRAIRGLDLESGIPRLVRGEYDCEWQSLNQLYMDDTVLMYTVSGADGSGEIGYISTETGELLRDGEQVLFLDTNEERFFAGVRDSFVTEYVYGTADSESYRTLFPQGESLAVYPVLDMGGVVTAQCDGDGTLLNLYDLDSGKRTASVRLEGVTGISDYAVDLQRQWIWLLDYDGETDTQTLYRWEPALSSVEDETDYSGTYETGLDPENPALQACRTEAARLERYYGVELRLADDALEQEPSDYRFTVEYKTLAIRQGLEMLEQGLSAYPAGFLKRLASHTDAGHIVISLTREITGDPQQGTLTEANGVQYWTENGDAYIALALSDTLVQDLYHEIFHVIDSYVLISCVDYDDWEKLNPGDFEYDYDYIQNQSRDGSAWLEGENRAFIDTYSMSFPGEDRARIMEYAMLPDAGDYFEPETMQTKLACLCRGIRTAFGWKELDRTLPWEQYLREPLTPESE